ncbi:Protein MSP1 [Madurella mycetomatis]|uniref:Protein MSP1 n=1 Tax=Madurella mycetomatis TaxID=100816 RepID=A0A175VW85_9PEZI|nr:Protein MSP1 [Madurella mycetomatis]
MPPSSNSSSSTSSKEYDQHEKKLLSGLINAKDIHTTFADIIVPQETKDSLIGLTSLSLIRPEAFSYGVLKTERIPGCLLYGPPGTGKTLLAKAVAKESGANMLEVSAASINDMWLGQSEKNVRALFSLARKLAPMVIFLDEADALLGARHNAPGRSGHRETITQFLREWDGLSDMRAFIMVATNRPFDLDEAVLRRLPRKILVDLPLRPEREAILRVMLKDESLAEDVDLAALGADAELYSGSDLKNLCVSAAMEAVREEVRQKDEFTGEGPFEYPERRVLQKRHFDKGLREISASISEDMDSLKAIRKFDEQYGDAGRRRRGKRTMGFEVVPGKMGTEEARVRQVSAA